MPDRPVSFRYGSPADAGEVQRVGQRVADRWIKQGRAHALESGSKLDDEAFFAEVRQGLSHAVVEPGKQAASLVVFVEMEALLSEAAKALAENVREAVVVLDGSNRVNGVLGLRSVVSVVAHGGDPHLLRVREVDLDPAFSAAVTDRLGDTLRRMDEIDALHVLVAESPSAGAQFVDIISRELLNAYEHFNLDRQATLEALLGHLDPE